MGHRDTGVGGNRDGAGDTGNDFKGDVVLFQKERFLAAPAKYEGIAALQAHHGFPFQGFIADEAADVVLFHGVMAGSLAHIDEFGCPGSQAENALVRQPVVDDYIGKLEGVGGFQGGEPPVAGTGANEKYFSGHYYILSFPFTQAENL